MERIRTFLARHFQDAALLLFVIAVTIGAFSGGFWFTLIGIFGLFFAFGTWFIDKKFPMPDRGLAVMAIVILLVSAGLNFHSFLPDVAWHEWIKLVTIFFPLCFLLSPRITPYILHPKLFNVLPVAITLGGLGLGILLYIKGRDMTARDMELNLAQYNRGFSYIMMMSFPAVAALWFSKKRWLVIPFFLLLLIPASFSESRSSKLALVLAMVVIAVAYFLPILTQRLLALTPFVTVGWPFAAQHIFITYADWLPNIRKSLRARLEIWDYMSYRIMEKPLLGWGLGTSSSLPFEEPHGALYVYTLIPAAHPHNVMTELWVELGVPGLILGIIFALLVLYKATRLDKRLVPFALGAWVAGFVLCLIAYNFWTDSLFASFALTGVAFMLLERKLKLSPFSEAGPTIH